MKLSGALLCLGIFSAMGNVRGLSFKVRGEKSYGKKYYKYKDYGKYGGKLLNIGVSFDCY